MDVTTYQVDVPSLISVLDLSAFISIVFSNPPSSILSLPLLDNTHLLEAVLALIIYSFPLFPEAVGNVTVDSVLKFVKITWSLVVSVLPEVIVSTFSYTAPVLPNCGYSLT